MSGLAAALSAVKDARWLEILDMGEAQLALFRAQAMRWVRPLGQLVKVADQPASATPEDLTLSRRDAAERFAKAIERATRYGIFRPKCLARAVALSQMLDAHGISGHRIRIGVRRGRGTFTAHAWVELGTWILGDSERGTRSYVPLAEAHVVSGRQRGALRFALPVDARLPDGQSMWDQ